MAQHDKALAKKLGGLGMVVVDRVWEGVDPASHYLLASATGTALVAGSDVQDQSAVCGRVLFVCRPPFREFGDAAETSELLGI